MDKQWYRWPIDSKEFREGLRQASDFSLTMAKTSLGIELKKTGQGRGKLNEVKKEIKRRKENG